ncbi:MAG: C-type lectin domain-containing protein [Lachnospiraceae bacterium]|nr:C-type lectin domain-containing protein [Lachnospiraceae bacterium]
MNKHIYYRIIILILTVALLLMPSCTTRSDSVTTNEADIDATEIMDLSDESEKSEVDCLSYNSVGRLISSEEMIAGILGEQPADIYKDSNASFNNWIDYYAALVYSHLLNDNVYYLAYLDEDDDPELIEYNRSCDITYIYSWKNPDADFRISGQIAYETYTGQILSKSSYVDADGKRIDYLADKLYTPNELEDCGCYYENPDEPWSILDVRIDTESYNALTEKYDFLNIKVLRYDNCYSPIEIMYVLNSGFDSSYGHRYEIIYDDLSWEEAKKKCEECGGYLAVITSYPEQIRIKELMDVYAVENSAFYIGCAQNADQIWYLSDGNYMNVGGGCIFVDMPTYSTFKSMLGEYASDDMRYGMAYYHRGYIGESIIYNMDLIYGPENLAEYNPDASGKVGYICEYDN